MQKQNLMGAWLAAPHLTCVSIDSTLTHTACLTYDGAPWRRYMVETMSGQRDGRYGGARLPRSPLTGEPHRYTDRNIREYV